MRSLLIVIYGTTTISALVGLVSANDFGGDFSANGLSGAAAPGADPGTMGNQAASAMAIGTGSSGAGDYASNYKTPNFTQYTQQDFKEFMPNYQDMMNTTMSAMGGGGSQSSMGAAASFTNFTSVNVMLKGFMDLQKEQLAVEKAKADASRAKLDLALQQHDDYAYDDEDDTKQSRKRRSVPLSGGTSKEAEGLALPLSSLSSATQGIAVLKTAASTLLGEDKLFFNSVKPRQGWKVRQVSGNWGKSANNWMDGGGGGDASSKWGSGMSGKQSSQKKRRGGWFRDTQSAGPPQGGNGQAAVAAGGDGGPAGGKNFWSNFGSMFTAAGGPTGGDAAAGKTNGGGQTWSNSGSSGSPPEAPAWGGGSSSGGSSFQPDANSGGQQSGAAASSPYMAQGSAGVSGGSFPGGPPPPPSPQQGNQRRSLPGLAAYPVHGAVTLSNVPKEPPTMMSAYNDNIPNLSFSLSPKKPAADAFEEPDESSESQPAMKEEPGRLLMTAPTSSGGYLMPPPPTSYRPTYVQMAAEPPTVLRLRPIVAKPNVPLASSSSSGGGPHFVYYYDGISAPGSTAILEEESIDNGPILVQQPTPSFVYQRSRKAAVATDEDPLVISMTDGTDNKKIMVDPKHGVLISTSAETRRKKRSVDEEDDDNDVPSTTSSTEATSVTTATTDPTELPKEEEGGENEDPNGHSHGKENHFKSEKMEAMMKPFMSSASSFPFFNSRSSRRVKIDFVQNGGELPEGAVETISAGGGKAPGHHEGGGLTVKVKDTGKGSGKRALEARKTLNFYFTW